MLLSTTRHDYAFECNFPQSLIDHFGVQSLTELQVMKITAPESYAAFVKASLFTRCVELRVVQTWEPHRSGVVSIYRSPRVKVSRIERVHSWLPTGICSGNGSCKAAADALIFVAQVTPAVGRIPHPERYSALPCFD